MERGATTPVLKYSLFRAIVLVLAILGSLTSSQAQETEDQAVDSVKTGSSLGKLKFENPDSIISKYTYDPKSDRYIYTESIGDFNVNYPLILTPDQYFELVRKGGMKSYFKEKIDAFSGKKEGSEEARKNLLPNFYINNNFLNPFLGEIPLKSFLRVQWQWTWA